MKHILFIFGTRPEAIKMAPLIKAMQEHRDEFLIRVCVTAQHREMLDQVLAFFQINPDYDLNLMQPRQSLFDITAAGLKALRAVFEDFKPDNVIVQGDTTSTFIGALAAYYQQVSISHLEAGLRSGEKYSPFPEEGNRILTSHLADYHFAPTVAAQQALAQEGIQEQVWVVGNTVIDALFLGLNLLKQDESRYLAEVLEPLDLNRKIVLITGHRRESFGQPFADFAEGIRRAAERFGRVQFVYPVHLNPEVQEPIKKVLGNINNVFLMPPLDYPALIGLMDKSSIVVTDSGGIQEEAPSLGKPVLVTRTVTERNEGIQANTAKLVGTDPDVIVDALSQLLEDESAYAAMAKASNPYGDGSASQQIVEILRRML